jgi:hypothetical protein
MLEKILSFFKPKNENLSENIEFNTRINTEDENTAFLNRSFEVSNPDLNMLDIKDEAVILAYSKSSVEDKFKEIAAHFDLKMRPLQLNIKTIDEKILELNLKLEELESKKEKLKGKIDKTEEGIAEVHHFLRQSLSFIFSLIMIFGTYILIVYWLKPVFQEASTWISIGVVSTGMFNLFNTRSFLHGELTPNWQLLLEGIGVPLAASLFVAFMPLKAHSGLESIVIGFYCFFSFLFSGKLLLGSIVQMQEDFQVLKRNFRLKKDKKSSLNKWINELDLLTEKTETLRSDKWKLRLEIDGLETDKQLLETQKQMMTHGFQAEYELASNYFSKSKISISK